jgi:hypothetical protein
MEFPPPPPEHPKPTRGLSKWGFFALAGGAVACAIFAGVFTVVANNEAHQAHQSIFQTTADQLSQQAQLEALVATGGWFATALLGVAALLVATVIRWGD